MDKYSAAKALVEKSQKDPVWWIETFLGVQLWEKQKEICMSIVNHKETSVKACHGVGKSFVAACITIWYLMSHRPSIVITTAPTKRQVEKVLWKEIPTRIKEAPYPLGGQMLSQEYRITENHFAFGFTATEYDATKFQGFHEYYLLAILDEACGISSEIQSGVSGVLTSPATRKLSIGNPTDITSAFADDFKPGNNIRKITVSVWDSPNFTRFGITREDIVAGTWPSKLGLDMDDTDKRLTKALEDVNWPNSNLVTPDWAAKHIKKWGINSPLWMGKGEAEFPDSSENNLIKISSIVDAVKRRSKPHLMAENNELILACDVARFGNDSTVIVKRRGPFIRIVSVDQKQDLMQTANKLAAMIKETKPDKVHIDDDGVGGGVVDRLTEMKKDGEFDKFCKIIRIRNASSPQDKTRFVTTRDECYGLMRDAFEAGDVDIEQNEELVSELQCIKYSYVSGGKLKVEPKDNIKKRIGKSPDLADAVAYSFAQAEEQTQIWIF